MKPVILVTASMSDDESILKLNRAYAEAIEAAGGIALIPDNAMPDNIPRLLEISDGILLSGGGDIDPSFFGEAPIKEIGEISPLRDKFEIELAKAAALQDKPMLSVCRGAQVMNVAFGGKVYQDIYVQVKAPLIKHSQDMPRRYASHSVKINEGTVLKDIVGRHELRVNSFHHQAVSVLGAGVKAAAFSKDGIIEAIEHVEMGFCLGVQWHPEHMTAEPVQFEIFKTFIRFAENNINRRLR